MEEEPNKSTSDVEDQPPQHPVIQSINILIQSAVKAQKSGVYTLQEASAIVESIKVLQEHFGKPKEDKPQNME